MKYITLNILSSYFILIDKYIFFNIKGKLLLAAAAGTAEAVEASEAPEVDSLAVAARTGVEVGILAVVAAVAKDAAAAVVVLLMVGRSRSWLVMATFVTEVASAADSQNLDKLELTASILVAN